jgi:hypothetical protein
MSMRPFIVIIAMVFLACGTVQHPPNLSRQCVGEEALSADQDVPRAVLPIILSLGRPMPSKPFPGQRRPPCIRGEREILGACWIGPIQGQEPPCGDRMFDYEGECYFASFDQDRQPTSERP